MPIDPKLQRKQMLFLDGIEASFWMARRCYERLCSTLDTPAEAGAKDLKTDARGHHIMLDAWGFVDVAKRLRALLQNTPGLAHTPVLKAFLAQTDDVPDMRHYIQHVDEKAVKVAETGLPLWGSIGWLCPTGFKGYIHGRPASGVVPLGRMPGLPPRGYTYPVYGVQLIVFGSELNLTDMFLVIEELYPKFEAARDAGIAQHIPGELVRVTVT